MPAIVRVPSPPSRYGVLRCAGRVVQVSWRGGGRVRVSGSRGRVRCWSPASRRRLLKVAGSVDWDGVRAEWGGAWLFLTLTYREDPGPERCKRDLDVLARRWARRWGHARWLWKMEFQRRGVPHFHFIGWVPKDGAVALAAYRWWLWDAWREIAGAGVRQRVDVDYARARDMVRYFVAYASTGWKASQHLVPASWHESSGRWWGVRGLPITWRERPLSRRQFFRIRRTLIRFRRAHSRYPIRCPSSMRGCWVLGERPRVLEGGVVRMLSEGG